MLLELLKAKAIEKGFLEPEDEIHLEEAFVLVRDMPYIRASSRDPQTIIEEWRGTCSGKHYLLKGLFAELGYSSRVIACTTVTHIDPRKVLGKLRKLLRQSDGRLVDVHNYLVLELPDGEMVVDATWPISTRGMGVVINEQFVLGENQKIAVKPLKSWVVPDDRDPQEFKNEILKDSFTADELAHRDEFLETLSKFTNSRAIKFVVRLARRLQGRDV
ncbi:MAG: hypothetical protein EHM40_11725 [Chloroflexi bacterium]|nr:MAG: hypothetical protein EHM40_11725 [Chloroflexota bacterium]